MKLYVGASDPSQSSSHASLFRFTVVQLVTPHVVPQELRRQLVFRYYNDHSRSAIISGYGQDVSSNGALSPLESYGNSLHGEAMVESDYSNPMNPSNINHDTMNPNWYTSDL